MRKKNSNHKTRSRKINKTCNHGTTPRRPLPPPVPPWRPFQLDKLPLRIIGDVVFTWFCQNRGGNGHSTTISHYNPPGRGNHGTTPRRPLPPPVPPWRPFRRGELSLRITGDAMCAWFCQNRGGNGHSTTISPYNPPFKLQSTGAQQRVISPPHLTGESPSLGGGDGRSIFSPVASSNNFDGHVSSLFFIISSKYISAFFRPTSRCCFC